MVIFVFTICAWGARNDAEKLPVVVVVQKGREEEYCFHVREKEMKERKKNKGVIGVKWKKGKNSFFFFFVMNEWMKE